MGCGKGSVLDLTQADNTNGYARRYPRNNPLTPSRPPPPPTPLSLSHDEGYSFLPIDITS
jgi:hypothetical protein